MQQRLVAVWKIYRNETMNIALQGKLKYITGKKGSSVYYHFTDNYHCRQRIALGITVNNPEKNKKGVWIFPQSAFDIAANIDKEVRDGRWGLTPEVKPEPILLQEAFDKFLNMKRPNIAASTISLHELSFKKLKEFFGNIPVEDISQEKMIAFRRYIIDKDKAENASWWLRHLSAFFNYCADADINIIQRTPLTKNVKVKSPDKPIIIFGENELQDLYEYITATYGVDAYNQFKFLELTGWRVGDSCILQRNNVDFSRRVIQQYVTKAKKFRDYPMDTFIEVFMKTLPIFDGHCFKYRSVHSLDHIFRDAIDKKVNHKLDKVSVHTLRKQFTYGCYRNGMPVEDCSRLLAHRSISTTLKYYHYWDTDNLRDSLEKSRVVVAKKRQKNKPKKLALVTK
jgi:integrase